MVYVNWATVEGMGDLSEAWTGDYSPGDTVELGPRGEIRLVEISAEYEPDVGPPSRHWLAIPKSNPDAVPQARTCLLCGDIAASSNLRCQCHEGCTDVSALAFLCSACLDSDTKEVAFVRDYVRRMSLTLT